MIALISQIAFCFTVAAGLIFILYCAIDSGWHIDTLKLVLVFLCILTFIGVPISIPSFLIMDKVTSTEYREPTSIIRTNDTVYVYYIGESKWAVHGSFYDAKYYNSSNIMVRINKGRNIWGTELSNDIDIDIYTNKGVICQGK